MSEDKETDSAGENPAADGMVKRQIAPSADTVEYDFLEIIAELEGVDVTDLPSLYHEVDHMVETLYETPPSAEAQLELAFSYSGYRIRMDQTGSVEVVTATETA